MIYLISVILLSFSALAQQSSPVLDPNKYTVCAITINSDDEKKVFDAQIKKFPDKYNPIVELTNFGKDDWFKKSCESNLKCDQLVISGHFAGDFFSESDGKSLKLKELEEASCSKSCDGILKNPYEVFLFGCNTLSGREGDSRTPAQYLQVLLADGIPLARAELVVESRYGSIGDSHKASMQRIFSGEKKQIYGFDSIGPSGKNIKGFLNNYFTKVNAPKRIELLESKRIFEKVDLTNKALADSLKITAFTQCPGGDSNDPVTKNLCALQDKNLSVEKRLDLIHGLLGEEKYLSYLPAINNFFIENSPSEYTADQKKELALISENKIIKQQIDGLIATTKSIALKNEWSSFANSVGFISNDEQKNIMQKAIIASFDKKMTEDNMDVLCKLDYSVKNKLDIKFTDIKNKQWGQDDMAALDCLDVKDPEIFQHAASQLKVIKGQDAIATTMGFITRKENIEVTVDPLVLAKTKNLLISNDEYYELEAMRFFARFSPKEPLLTKTLQGYMTSTEINYKQIAVSIYASMKEPPISAVKQISSIVKNSREPNLVNQAIYALTKIKVTDPAVLKEMNEAQNLPHLSSVDKIILKNYLESVEIK